ncbi:desmethyl-deoxy-podophyllotoxin synthase-like [Prosopis cineraria]|uniref:desmethyl-deoxy-podophyllotoxin synthase-like n=1 Tax=Prosopis cineraria TaxID=364024 RepID=UPI00240EB521|nr:desmethyl-deoxy-podophyllotoxin synthase-like [Prosopis cineraria]
MGLQFLFFPSFCTPLMSSLLFIVSLITILFRTSNRTQKNLNLPPGPRMLPFLGSMHHLLIGSENQPNITLRNLAQKYGPLMHLKLGERSTIVVSSPDVAKQGFKTHDLIFAQRPNLLSAEIFLYNSTEIAFSPYGLYWRHLRKLCTLQLFSPKRVRSFQSIRVAEVGKLARDISMNIGRAVNLGEKIYAMTFAIVTRAAFGDTCKDQEAFISVVKEMVTMVRLQGFAVNDLFPSKKWLQVITGERRRFEEIHRKCDALLQKLIDEGVSTSGEGEETESLLYDLLNLRDRSGPEESRLTINDAKSVILDVFIAGTETSSTLLKYAVLELLRNPELLKRAQAEVRQVFNKQGHVREEELDELKYMKAVLKETMRLHPPLPLLVPRDSSESCEINGFTIPPKTQMLVIAWASGRDPTRWDRAEEFVPERFLESEIDYKGLNFELIPFGAGRRICPGITLALANVELPLANLLFHFDWQLLDEHTATLDQDLLAVPVSYHHAPSLGESYI